MSQFTHHPAALRALHVSRRQIVIFLALLAIAGAVVLALSITGGSDSQTVSRYTQFQTGGPSEAARGQAAAVAAGVAIPAGTGGPDETARGQSVHSAARATSAPRVGGPDETLRGQAVHSATR